MQVILKTLKNAFLISGDLNANIGKDKIRYHRYLIDSKVDSEELSNDWYKIGEDLNKSIKNYRNRELMYNGR